MTDHVDIASPQGRSATDLPDAPMAMPEQPLQRRSLARTLRRLLTPWSILSWARAR